MSSWKNRLVVLTVTLLSVTFPIFLVTGYTALYWAWVRANLPAALPYLPWARNFGMLAMAGAALALGILFSANTFPLPLKFRLVTMLSLLEPEGLGWTLATVGAGMGFGTAAFLLAKRAGQQGFTTLFGRNDDAPKG